MIYRLGGNFGGLMNKLRPHRLGATPSGKPVALDRWAIKIVIGTGRPPIDAQLIDLSAGSACLEVADAEQIPKAFEIIFIPTNVKKRCRVAWKRGQRVGVAF